MSPLRRPMGGTGRRLRRLRVAERHEPFALTSRAGASCLPGVPPGSSGIGPLRSAHASAIALPQRRARRSVRALRYGTRIKTLVEHKTPCIYCSDLADSLEHPLPAAFGEFTGAPQLRDRICSKCNNVHLGVLDEQLVRCGPEGFLRQYYRVRGRPDHDSVNSFYRGSAGGHRLEMKGWDSQLGIEVLLECKDGECTQARQLIFIEDSGRWLMRGRTGRLDRFFL